MDALSRRQYPFCATSESPLKPARSQIQPTHNTAEPMVDDEWWPNAGRGGEVGTDGASLAAKADVSAGRVVTQLTVAERANGVRSGLQRTL
jgi:hypothetical protein